MFSFDPRKRYAIINGPSIDQLLESLKSGGSNEVYFDFMEVFSASTQEWVVVVKSITSQFPETDLWKLDVVIGDPKTVSPHLYDNLTDGWVEVFYNSKTRKGRTVPSRVDQPA